MFLLFMNEFDKVKFMNIRVSLTQQKIWQNFLWKLKSKNKNSMQDFKLYYFVSYKNSKIVHSPIDYFVL